MSTLLSIFQWKKPAWSCQYNINEYWEFVKYGVTGETDKLAMVRF